MNDNQASQINASKPINGISVKKLVNILNFLQCIHAGRCQLFQEGLRISEELSMDCIHSPLYILLSDNKIISNFRGP